MLSIGIVGLPNVGKSTLFNILTMGTAGVSNYPFTTIDSNFGIVPVPDPRLDRLAKMLKPKEAEPAVIRFIDIAGLVQGASKGEGLGNQFLGNIREVDAIVHVVRCFQDAEVSHVLGEVDPARDVDIIETELLLADLEVIDRAIGKRERNWKTSPRQHADEESRLRGRRRMLASGRPLRALSLSPGDLQEMKGLGLLSGKPVLYVANVSESAAGPDQEDDAFQQLRSSRLADDPQAVALSLRLEADLQQLEEPERNEFMQAYELSGSGIERLIRSAYRLLDLVTFYTFVNEKLRAWPIRSGTVAREAAGRIHSDMESGFIRAHVFGWEDLLKHGSVAELHRLGLVRTEGKQYSVRDGDVIEFLFSN